jgi:hypothetical protein
LANMRNIFKKIREMQRSDRGIELVPAASHIGAKDGSSEQDMILMKT